MSGGQRLRKPPVKFSPWQDGDKHPPMAKRKQQGKEKKEKEKKNTNQEKYRETMTKEKKKEYNKTRILRSSSI